MIIYVIYLTQIVKVMNMKKNYSKPALVFEDFSVMDAITTGCGYPAQHAEKASCSCKIEYGGINFITFIDGNTACEVPYQAIEVGISDVIFPS